MLGSVALGCVAWRETIRIADSESSGKDRGLSLPAFGARVRALRRLRKFKGQEGLASALGVSQATISRWEKSGSLPDIEMLKKLAKELGTDWNWLLVGEDGARAALQWWQHRDDPIPLPGRRRAAR